MAALEYIKAVVSTFQSCAKQRAGTVASIDTTTLHLKATKQLPNTLCLQVESAIMDDAQMIEPFKVS